MWNDALLEEHTQDTVVYLHGQICTFRIQVINIGIEVECVENPHNNRGDGST